MQLLLPYMKWVTALLLALILVVGCSRGSVHILGGYYLEKFPENNHFYLRRRGDGSIGGVFDGYLLSIGVSTNVIIAYVKRLYRGDVDGWYMLDVKSGRLTGPLSDGELTKVCSENGITCEPIDLFWTRSRGNESVYDSGSNAGRVLSPRRGASLWSYMTQEAVRNLGVLEVSWLHERLLQLGIFSEARVSGRASNAVGDHLHHTFAAGVQRTDAYFHEHGHIGILCRLCRRSRPSRWVCGSSCGHGSGKSSH